MYSILHKILSDRKGGEVFKLFSGWHFFYIGLTAAAIITIIFLFKRKSENEKAKLLNILINTAFGIYIADLFLMPLAYGEIDIEKLPFHACTAMCLMCFLSHRNAFLSRFRLSFALLGFISNLVYLIYPAGVMWHGVYPISYRVIQTLIFHSLMTVYGLLTIVYEWKRINIKKCHLDLAVLCGMTIWALIGNYAYNGTSDGYSHFFNWFFVVRDPFYMLDEKIAPFIMPFLNIAIFFAAEMLVHLVVLIVKGRRKTD